MVMLNRVVVTIFIVLLLSSCSKFKEPLFNNIQNVELVKPGLDRSLMVFEMECFNPNNLKVKLIKAEGDAWLDSTYLGHFVVDTSVNIPANSIFLIPVKLDLEMKNMLKLSLSSFLNDEVLLSIRGRAKLGKSGFYKRYPLNYEGKKNLRALFKQ
jgi:LEA14-like dessication related protein